MGVMQKEGEGCIEATFYLIPGNYCRKEKATARNYEVDAVILPSQSHPCFLNLEKRKKLFQSWND